MKWYPLPSYADLYTWEEFRECVKDGSFINYDGTGRFANTTSETDVYIDCTLIRAGTQTPPEGCTHVAWYNR